jgi:hypothetical protein
MESAWEETAFWGQVRLADPSSNGFPRWLGNLELNGPLSFLLHYDRPRCHDLTVADISHLKPDQIAGTELAVYCQVEKGKLAPPIGELQTHANGPDLLQLERCLLSENLAFVPRRLDG